MSTAEQRNRLVNLNIFASVLIKGWMGLVQLALIPATLHCLGIYVNGVWLTLAAMLVWIDQMDIGLGNGLRNEIAKCMAADDNKGASEAVSSVVGMLVFIVVPLVGLLVAAVFWGDVHSWMNVDSRAVPELASVVMVTLLMVGVQFVLKSIGNVYMGMQMNAVSNAFVAAGQTLQLLLILVADGLGMHSLMAVALMSTIAPVMVYAVAFPITLWRVFPQLKVRLGLFKWAVVRRMAGVSLEFFVIQLSGLVFLSASNLLISNLYSPQLVTPYQVAFRYTSLAIVAYTIVLAPYWNSTTDAYARGDLAWIRAAAKRLQRFIAAMACLLVVMCAAAPWVFRLWVGDAGESAVGLSWMLAGYTLLLIYQSTYSYLLNGMGVLRWQVVANVLAAVLFVPITLLLSRQTDWGVASIIVGMIVANVPIAVINRWQFAVTMRRASAVNRI